MKLLSSRMAEPLSKARKNPALPDRCIRRWWVCNEDKIATNLEAARYRACASRKRKIHKRLFFCVFCAFLWPFLFMEGEATAAGDRLVFGLQAAYGLENDIPRNISHIQMIYAQPQIGYV